MKWATYVLCFMLCACQTAQKPIVLPPEIIKVVEPAKLPEPCAAKAHVELPPNSTATDVMAKQKKAIDELEAQVQRCFRPAG